MREIKYRAWDTLQGGKFEYWNSKTDKYNGIFWTMIKNKSFKEPNLFTGLRDKNGEDIYEGDIINCIEEDEILGDTIHKNCIVIFDRCAFFYCPNMNTKQPHQCLYWASSIEIIGNIYQNGKS